MAAPETSQPVPQFDVPSGFTPGPWHVDAVGLIRDHQNGRMIADCGVHDSRIPFEERKANERAIAAIPTVVEEIGRLRRAWHDAECGRDRLRALNAELREPIKDYIRDFLNCRCDPSKCHTARRRLELQRLLAKSEATISEPSSAPPNRGPGLPAQDNPPQPAPGGTATENEAR
jgi:hypothetical protein